MLRFVVDRKIEDVFCLTLIGFDPGGDWTAEGKKFWSREGFWVTSRFLEAVGWPLALSLLGTPPEVWRSIHDLHGYGVERFADGPFLQGALFAKATQREIPRPGGLAEDTFGLDECRSPDSHVVSVGREAFQSGWAALIVSELATLDSPWPRLFFGDEGQKRDFMGALGDGWEVVGDIREAFLRCR
ncbi:MAG: hypothetical protein BGO01_06415 [Armatimonadetes bacterium 55-13]|nr:hypothetical protein [Armatimonadota bacterium]OJU65112.1 MAG: hypothetical protein BGO01_06415 [Armatimonadetes bacterium 55-13]